MTKRCSRCRKTKKFSEFNSRPKQKHGLSSSCKKCHNREVKKYRGTKRGASLKKAWAKKYGAADSARRARTVHGKAVLLLQGSKRAIRKGVRHSITAEDIEPLLVKALARGHVVLEPNAPNIASLDRKIPGKGYVKGNIQIVPWWLNAAYAEYPKRMIEALIRKWVNK